MRWKDDRRTENVEDRRRIRPAGIVIGGGIGALILALVTMFRGTEPRQLVNLPQNHPHAAGQPPSPPAKPDHDSLKDFASVILGDTEDVWHEQFGKMNRDYRKPRLVLFTGQVQTACGLARPSAHLLPRMRRFTSTSPSSRR